MECLQREEHTDGICFYSAWGDVLLKKKGVNQLKKKTTLPSIKGMSFLLRKL